MLFTYNLIPACFAADILFRDPENDQEKTGINVMIAQDTVSCVALGTGKALDNLDAIK